MAPLHRAIALAEIDHLAVGVGHQLDLHVTGPHDRPLHEDPPVPEGGLGLAGCRLERPRQRRGFVDDPHALATTAGRRLDHHGKTDPLGGPLCRRHVGHVLDPGHHGHPRLDHRSTRGDLVAHHLHRRPRRPHEDDARLVTRPHERGLLAEEAIAGMDRLGPGATRGLDDPLRHQVAVARGRRPDAVGLVGIEHMRRAAIRLAVHRDRGDAVLATGAKDPASDLATVGHENLTERRRAHPTARFTKPRPPVVTPPGGRQGLTVSGSTNTRPSRRSPTLRLRSPGRAIAHVEGRGRGLLVRLVVVLVGRPGRGR